MRGAGSIKVEKFSQALADELGRFLVEPLVVVVDDAEHLSELPGTPPSLRPLIGGSHALLSVAIASRRPLGLPAAKLTAAGRLTTLGEVDLAFTATEAEILFAEVREAPAEPETIDRLMALTEGWPLALALLARTTGEPDLRPGQTRESLFSYLVSEALADLDPALSRAVLDSSVVARLDSETVEALGLEPNFIENIRRAGLTIRRDPEDRDRLSLDPLFREALLDRVRTERSAAELRSIHRRAGTALAKPEPVEAVNHLLEGEAWDEALDVIVANAFALMKTASESIGKWLASMPKATAERPGAQLLRGGLELNAGRHVNAVPPLAAAVEGFRAEGEIEREWAARLVLVDTLFWLAEYERMADLAEGFDEPGVEVAGILAPAVALWGAIGVGAIGKLDRWKDLSERAIAHPHGGPLKPLEILRQSSTLMPSGRLDHSSRGSSCRGTNSGARATQPTTCRTSCSFVRPPACTRV